MMVASVWSHLVSVLGTRVREIRRFCKRRHSLGALLPTGRQTGRQHFAHVFEKGAKFATLGTRPESCSSILGTRVREIRPGGPHLAHVFEKGPIITRPQTQSNFRLGYKIRNRTFKGWGAK